MPTPHPPDHAPDYDLRRDGNRVRRVCRLCQNAAKRGWARRNPEKVREMQNRWRAKRRSR